MEGNGGTMEATTSVGLTNGLALLNVLLFSKLLQFPWILDGQTSDQRPQSHQDQSPSLPDQSLQEKMLWGSSSAY